MKYFLIYLLISCSGVTFSQNATTLISTAGETYTNSSLTLDWALGEMAISERIGTRVYLTEGFLQNYKNLTKTIDLFEEPRITIFPNPTTRWINILSSLEISKTYLQDLNGEILIKSRNKNIDVRNLSSGEYILTLLFKNNQHKSYKIIIVQ